MTDIMMTDYRHAKIAELLAIMWACNAADSDNPPTWTRPAMAGTVCNPLMKAVRGLLNADFYIYDDVDRLTEEVITMLIDDNASNLFHQLHQSCAAATTTIAAALLYHH